MCIGQFAQFAEKVLKTIEETKEWAKTYTRPNGSSEIGNETILYSVVSGFCLVSLLMVLFLVQMLRRKDEKLKEIYNFASTVGPLTYCKIYQDVQNDFQEELSLNQAEVTRNKAELAKRQLRIMFLNYLKLRENVESIFKVFSLRRTIFGRYSTSGQGSPGTTSRRRRSKRRPRSCSGPQQRLYSHPQRH